MLLVDNKISVKDLEEMSHNMFNNIVKAVVDIEKGVMVVNADLHADQEQMLLEMGSDQKNLWGINLHPALVGSDDWIEFDSMINLRPIQGNKSRGIEDVGIRKQIISIVNRLVEL